MACHKGHARASNQQAASRGGFAAFQLREKTRNDPRHGTVDARHSTLEPTSSRRPSTWTDSTLVPSGLARAPLETYRSSTTNLPLDIDRQALLVPRDINPEAYPAAESARAAATESEMAERITDCIGRGTGKLSAAAPLVTPSSWKKNFSTGEVVCECCGSHEADSTAKEFLRAGLFTVAIQCAVDCAVERGLPNIFRHRPPTAKIRNCRQTPTFFLLPGGVRNCPGPDAANHHACRQDAKSSNTTHFSEKVASAGPGILVLQHSAPRVETEGIADARRP